MRIAARACSELASLTHFAACCAADARCRPYTGSAAVAHTGRRASSAAALVSDANRLS